MSIETINPGDPGYDETMAKHEERLAGDDGPVEDPSGVTPIEYKVLVLPDDVPEKTAGGILVPIWARDQRQSACITGTVIAIADEAFSFMENTAARVPEIGDRVAFARYAGDAVKGRDKKMYKLMNDKDIAAVLDFPFDPKHYEF